MTYLVGSFRVVLFLVLVIAWISQLIHLPVSEFVSANLPAPSAKAWIWPKLVAEAAVIEILVCLPMAYVIYVAFRARALEVARVLGIVFCIRVLFELPSPINPPAGTVFLMYMTICHVILLVGGTGVFMSRKAPSNLLVDSDAQGRSAAARRPLLGRRSHAR